MAEMKTLIFSDIEWDDEGTKQIHLKALREEGWEPINEELVPNKHETVVTFRRMQQHP